jgi:hypothetical protein
MRWGVSIIIGILLSGCAAQKHPSADASKPQPLAPPRYLPAASGSLVFDPPVTLGEPPLQLSREGRAPDAFVGYESTTATYFYLRVDDRQTSDAGNRYERRAISTKVGVTYR